MHYLVSLIIPLVSFFLQSYPRFFNKYFGIDVWTRLIEIDHVKKAKHKIPGKITKGFIISGYFDYPIIFPWIFSFFPKKLLLHFQGFISPIFDVLQNIIVFYIAKSLFHSTTAGVIAQAIYTLTPILPIENSYLTPRSLGYLNHTLAFFPLLLYSINHNPIFLIAGFISTVFLFLTHRFALQAFIFLSIFFSVFDKSFLYVLNLLFAFLTVVIITKGYYLRVLRGHLSNIYFWVLHKDFRFAHQIFGNRKNKKKDWVSQIYTLLSIFSPVFMVIINCWILSSAVYIYLLSTKKIAADPLLIKMAAWVIFFYIFGSIVLKIKQLIPVGEGQRYLEMATVPSAILSTFIFLYFFRTANFLSVVVFGCILTANLLFILIVQMKGIIKDKNRSLTEDLLKVYAYINKLKKRPRIICIPHGITTMTVYNTKSDVLVNADNPGLLKITNVLPILKLPLHKLKILYKLDYLLLRENYASIRDLKLSKNKIVYKSGDICLVKL